MSRRSSRKSEKVDIAIGITETVVSSNEVKVEAVEIISKSTPAKTTKKNTKDKPEAANTDAKIPIKLEPKVKAAKTAPKPKIETDSEDEEDEPAPKKKAPVKRKAKIQEEVGEEDESKETAPKKRVPVKRKPKEEQEDEDAQENKPKKKRKTKEEKEAEEMPIAARTAVGSLKKALYIGAHVSAAGGTFG